MSARIGLLNPAFKYTKAAETNVAKTFARIKRELAAAKPAQPSTVRVMRKKADAT